MKNRFSLEIAIIFFLATCLIKLCIGQELPGDNIFPPPPNAASLGQYGDHKVNLYTGSPSINIPIWEIESDGVKLPISLTYNASGIRVEEIASRVGLGWSLNSGGVITRTVRGHRDEIRYLSDFVHRKPLEELEADEMRFLSTKDLQADIFYYNFNGYTGKFVFDKDGIPHSIPYNKLKIEPNESWIADHNIDSWTITTEDGTKYIFEVKEFVINSSTGARPSQYGTGVSSWYLSTIISPKSKQECIHFEYADYEVPKFTTSRSQSYSVLEYVLRVSYNAVPNSYSSNEQRIVSGRRIKRIWSRNCEIDFVADEERKDFPGDNAITSIIIKTRNGSTSTPIREFNLKHEYMANGIMPNDDYPTEEMRLMLTEVQESFNGVEKNPYKFTYYLKNNKNRGLPSRLSFAQDHWGGFNGKVGNTHLIPSLTYTYLTVHGADRSPDESSAVCGTLEEITYPTKGKTLFEYELNEVPTTTLANGSLKEYNANVLEHSLETSADPQVTEEILEFTLDKTLTVSKLFKYWFSSSPTHDVFNSDITSWPVDFELREKGSSDPIFLTQWGNGSGSGQITLSAGTYEIEYVKHSNPNPSPASTDKFTFGITWDEEILPTPEQTTEVGGLRIKSMQTTDAVSGVTNIKNYTYTNSAGISTGRLVSTPFYRTRYTTVVACGFTSPGNGPLQTPTAGGSTVIFSSSSNLALANTQGNTVGYSTVHIDYNGNGSKTQRFTSPETNPDLQWLPGSSTGVVNGGHTNSRGDVYLGFRSSTQAPYAPVDSREWQRGLLLEENTYREDGTMVKSIVNRYATYDDLDVNGMSTPNYVLGFKASPVYSGDPCGYESFGFAYYSTSWGYSELTETTETEYDENEIPLVSKVTNYEYNTENLKQSIVTTSGSKGETIKTEYYYPHDYPNNAIYEAMVTSNVITPVVVSETKVNNFQTNGTRRNYTEPHTGTGIYLPTSIEKWEKGGVGYVPRSYYEYNIEGKIVSLKKEDGIQTSILWAYDKTYPVAKIENASISEVESVISSYRPILEKELPTNSELKMIVDKLREELPSAMVTGYTYKPLIGISSQTDPRGIRATYEYDALGRLKQIVDHEGNVLQKQEYNYKE